MNSLIKVYIEIEKNSNIKYEYDKNEKKLLIDRILDFPYFYPYAYGFIPNTLGNDNDELDILIITDKKIEKDRYYNAYIIGLLEMSDEKGMDEKILCILEEDYNEIYDIDCLDEKQKNNIYWFFSNYKNNTKDKWSKVTNFQNKEFAINLYNSCLIKDNV
jgi:inorganic pyrophosphatase